jgi:AcrR family transcriptional regulator
MPRMSAKERREELIEAAIRVMVREGVTKATTRAIVAEAGMTLGVFHYCFTSREELLQEVTRRITDRSVVAAREAFAHERDIGASITKSLHAFWENVELHPGEQLIGYELAQYALRQEGLQELAQRQYAHYLEVHAELLEEAADAADIEWTVPIPVLARYLNSVLDGLTSCWLGDRDSACSQEVLRLTGEHLMGLTRERKPSTD